MGVGAFVEPLVVISLLLGGTYINRNTSYIIFSKRQHIETKEREDSPSDIESLLLQDEHRSEHWSLKSSRWHMRTVWTFGTSLEVKSPDTTVFRDHFLSRVLRKFPFLVEAWYWALIYWVYQLGRAYTAVHIVEGTVDVARRHALEIIAVEQRLHVFHELDVQAFFLRHPDALHWLNRIYSFIHIPGTIAFLVWLYYYTTPCHDTLGERGRGHGADKVEDSPRGPMLYEARRRTMAVCNLLSFVIFTAYPCMPPRLLSDQSVKGPSGDVARSFGFVDTVHDGGGEGSVWTQNRFCNQYAAMPSLHFGYSLLIGLTIATLPLSPASRRTRALNLPFLCAVRFPTLRRVLCVFVGMAYALTILIAIVATANHFFLDAVVGALVCAVAWRWNGVLLCLLPVEDWFLWAVRICKPTRGWQG